MQSAEQVSQGADAFSASWVPISSHAAERLAADLYGIQATAKRLSSERDDTFQLTDGSGISFTLKIAHPLEDQNGLRFQDGAMLHLEKAAPGVPVPRLVKTLSGDDTHRLPQEDGGFRTVRLLTYLEGDVLSHARRSVRQCQNIGTELARLARGLADYNGMPPDGKFLWDISHILDKRPLLAFVDPDRRPAIDAVIAGYESTILPRAAALRRQIIHNDMNPHNILVHPDAPETITGIIDFGDMVLAPIVNDVAVAASYHLSSQSWMDNLCALVKGYDAITPLQDEEFSALPLLIKARLALTVMITEWRSTERPAERDYILRNHAASWAGLQNLNGLSEQELAGTIRTFCKD